MKKSSKNSRLDKIKKPTKKMMIILSVVLIMLMTLILSNILLSNKNIINKLKGEVSSTSESGQTNKLIILDNYLMPDENKETFDFQIYNGSDSQIEVIGIVIEGPLEGQRIEGALKDILGITFTVDSHKTETIAFPNENIFSGTYSLFKQFDTNILKVGFKYKSGDDTYFVYNDIYSSNYKSETMKLPLFSDSSLVISNNEKNIFNINLNDNLIFQIVYPKHLIIDKSELKKLVGLFSNPMNDLTSISAYPTYEDAKKLFQYIPNKIKGPIFLSDAGSKLSTTADMFGEKNSSNINEYFTALQKYNYNGTTGDSDLPLYTLTMGTAVGYNNFSIFSLAYGYSADIGFLFSFFSSENIPVLDNVKITPGLYFKYRQDDDDTTEDLVSTSSEFSSILNGEKTVPYFYLTVYDKSNLKTAVEKATETMSNTKNDFKTSLVSEYNVNGETLIHDAVLAYNNLVSYSNGVKTVNINQTEIDRLTEELNRKTNFLEKRPIADYSSINTYKGIIDNINRNRYDDNAFDKVDKEISNVVYDLSEAYQIRVNYFAKKIEEELNKIDADYTDIDNLLKTINTLNGAKYTVDSWNTLKSAKGKIVTGKKLLEQTLVDDMYTSLFNAYNSLVLKDNVTTTTTTKAVTTIKTTTKVQVKKANTDKLKEVYKKALALNKSYYEDITELESAMSEYPNVINATIDEQEKVDEVTRKISDAISKLSYKPADYTKIDELKVVIDKLDSSKYANFDGVTTALGNIIYGKKINEQDQVKTMYKDLKTAYDSLIVINKEDITYSNYLSSLMVKDNEIEFEKEKQTYNVKIDKKTDKLDLSAIAEDDTSVVTIIGNENLKDGSKVKVEVKSADRKVRIYTLNVQKAGYVNVKIIISLIVLLILLAVTLLIIKNKKKIDQ